jgi:hypothetical protein
LGCVMIWCVAKAVTSMSFALFFAMMSAPIV